MFFYCVLTAFQSGLLVGVSSDLTKDRKRMTHFTFHGVHRHGKTTVEGVISVLNKKFGLSAV